jgi:hypothetical protein
VEETGPHFFDEDPADEPARPSPADTLHGSRPEPASAWGADRAQQSGFGDEQDRRVSWGAAKGADPRLPGPASPEEGTATNPPAEPDADSSADSPGTVVFRRPTRAEASAEGTMTFRKLTPRAGEQGGSTGAAGSGPGQADAARPANAQAAARQALGLDPDAPDAAQQRSAAAATVGAVAFGARGGDARAAAPAEPSPAVHRPRHAHDHRSRRRPALLGAAGAPARR